MPLNLAQQKYARERVRKAKETRLKLLKEEFTKPPKEPSDKAKLSAIACGNIYLKRAAKLTHTLEEAFDFSELTVPDELDNKPYDKAVIALEAEANKLLDKVMLGDATLDDISQFCEGV